ncbi:MAG: SusD/RagB family nutrient-binding outer membrane lipoprotein [Bacteroidales bacterium]|nr:SusD/RagB family nutrient-binding outer membrane lipoprotein [Bacteroidales bacterium]
MRKILISLTLFLVIGTSCTKWLDVNKNVDAPDWVVPILRLAPTIAAYEGIAFDIRALAPMMQYFGGGGYSGVFGLHSYYSGSDAGGEAWRFVYWLQGKNIEHIIDDGRAREEFTLAGMGLAIKAYSWHLLASLHGDLPVKDAFVPGLLAHSYDTQDYAFAQVRKWAREAIAEFDKQDKNVYPTLATNDLIYAGNVAKWKKFAYATLARNYIAMSMKDAKYLDSAIACADLSFSSAADDASFRFDATGISNNTNFIGVLRANMAFTYTQSDYMVQVMTGTIPNYNASGAIEGLLEKQIITDTATLDPRTILMFGSRDTMPANQNDIKKGTFNFVGTRQNFGVHTSFWGGTASPTEASAGKGRWLFRDDARFPLTTYAEIQLIKAEALFRKGQKAPAFEAFKLGVSGHMDFVKSFIVPGTPVKNAANKQTSVIGDKIGVARFNVLAAEYMNSKFVNALPLNDFSLSHIMMQKYVSMYPWSLDTWNDLRRYHYDLVLGAGGVPVTGTSYTTDVVYHKLNTDATRIYKGFYLPPSDVINRRQKFAAWNYGAPCYRLRPRYNSEYMWNLGSLKKLTPIAGDADNYHTSIVWFAQPGN